MLYVEPALLLGLFLLSFILCHLKLVHFRSENGGVEPAGRDVVSGAGNRFPGRARTARWAFLPCTPCQTSSLCGSLISCFISLPYLSLSLWLYWNFHCYKTQNYLSIVELISEIQINYTWSHSLSWSWRSYYTLNWWESVQLCVSRPQKAPFIKDDDIIICNGLLRIFYTFVFCQYCTAMANVTFQHIFVLISPTPWSGFCSCTPCFLL